MTAWMDRYSVTSERFLKEVDPRCSALHRLCSWGGDPFISLDYMNGRTLSYSRNVIQNLLCRLRCQVAPAFGCATWQGPRGPLAGTRVRSGIHAWGSDRGVLLKWSEVEETNTDFFKRNQDAVFYLGIPVEVGSPAGTSCRQQANKWTPACCTNWEAWAASMAPRENISAMKASSQSHWHTCASCCSKEKAQSTLSRHSMDSPKDDNVRRWDFLCPEHQICSQARLQMTKRHLALPASSCNCLGLQSDRLKSGSTCS